MTKKPSGNQKRKQMLCGKLDEQSPSYDVVTMKSLENAFKHKEMDWVIASGAISCPVGKSVFGALQEEIREFSV
jgi:hypothetical protein